MRIACPICGERDRREFYYMGHAVSLDRPAPDAGLDTWHDHVYLRDNPAGMTRDLWYHEAGCTAWLVVTRSTTTHEIAGVELVSKADRGTK